MDRFACSECGRLVARHPGTTGATGWVSGVGFARINNLSLHGPRDARCPGRRSVEPLITPREQTYTDVWSRQVGPVPDRHRVQVHDRDPERVRADCTDRYAGREAGFVWLTLVCVDAPHDLVAVSGPVKVAEVAVRPRGEVLEVSS